VIEVRSETIGELVNSKHTMIKSLSTEHTIFKTLSSEAHYIQITKQ